MAVMTAVVHTPGLTSERTNAVERSDQDVVQGGARSELTPPTDGRAPTRVPAVDQLLTPGEVARLFGVDPKTVSRWADAGKLDAMRTLGGHRRYRVGEVEALLEAAGSN